MLHFLFRFLLFSLSLNIIGGAYSNAQMQAHSRQELLDQAQVFTQEKDFTSAIQIYRKLLKLNARDTEVKVLLATVTAWSGKYDQARILYEQVLSENPDYADAEMGLARVFFWQNKYTESLRVLRHALEKDPANLEARDLRLKVLQASKEALQFKVRVAGHFEHLSFFTNNAWGEYASLNWSRAKAWAIRTSFFYLDKFDASNAVLSMGGTYWLSKRLILSADLDAAPISQALPQESLLLDLNSVFLPQVAAGMSYRFSHYHNVDVHTINPHLFWTLMHGLELRVHGYFVFTYFVLRKSFPFTSSFLLTLHAEPWNWLGFDLGYGAGTESFDPGNPSRPLGTFMAQHVVGGIKVLLGDNFGFDTNVDAEFRSSGQQVTVVESGLSYSW